MQLVEQHVIGKNDSRFQAIDEAAFASKNLYNAANYRIRQEFIFNNRYIFYPEMDKQMQSTCEYLALPAKVAQQVLITLDKNWKSYFAAIAEWDENPDKFNGKPRIPGYLDKQGRNGLLYTIQAVSKPKLEEGRISPSKLDICVKTKQQPQKVACVRIVPKKTHYIVEVVYEREEKQADVEKSLIAGVDIGLNNLAAVASNKPGNVKASC